MKIPSVSILPGLFAAACAADGFDSSNISTLPPQGGNTDAETTEICSNAAQCRVAKTSEECERLLWQADGNASANIQITPLSNRLVSGDGSLQDEFDTDDTVSAGALEHFACARLLIDSSHDVPDGGEWISDGSTLTTREGGALTVQVDFEEALVDHATAAELCIGVQDGQTPRWGTLPNGNTSCLTYINTSDGFTY